MNNWVLVLYVITVMNQHGYRSTFYYADPPAAFTSKMECEAELRKEEGLHDAECTPFRANMGPISTLYFCRGCTEEQSVEAMKGVGGRVEVTPKDWRCDECTPAQRRAALVVVGTAKATEP
jgi:hypothetical protein